MAPREEPCYETKTENVVGNFGSVGPVDANVWTSSAVDAFTSLWIWEDWGVPLAVTAGQLAGGARIDEEGTITGSALTKRRALISTAISCATGKILDDAIEEGAKSIYGMAAAGSADIVARYVGLGAGVAIFLLHRGREVKLDTGTELSLSFARPVEVTPATAVSAPRTSNSFAQ